MASDSRKQQHGVRTRPCRCRLCTDHKKATGRHPFPKGSKSHPPRYEVRWRQDGRQYSKGGFARKADAEAFLVGKRADVQRAVATDPTASRRTFRDLATDWLADHRHSVRPRTWEGYAYIVNARLIPTFGDVAVGKVGNAQVRRFIRGMQAEGLSPQTQRNNFNVLKQVFDLAVEDGAMAGNPCRNSRLRAVLDSPQHDEQLFLTADELHALAEHFADRDPQMRVLVYLAGYGGLRLGELRGLRVRDVNALNGNLRVSRSVTPVKAANHDLRATGCQECTARFHVGPPKNGQRRTVQLPGGVARMLRDAAADRAPDDLIFTAPPLPDGRFRGDNPRGFLVGESVSDKFKAGARAALPDEQRTEHRTLHNLRLHDLRHTCAALLIANGEHAKAISNYLGHRSIQITMDRYGHLFPEEFNRLADALDRTYRSATLGRVTA